jgi:TupA-like ATPgrasp
MTRVLINAVKGVLPELATDVLIVMQKYKQKFGAYPNLIRPTTYNEKTLYRMLFDRRPIWTQLQDKYLVREYVKARIGEQALPRLYWVTKDPGDIPFDDLPEKYVVKPNHGSGWIVFVPDKAQVNRQELVETCRGWLRQNYYYHFRERHYKPIIPRILVEEYIDDGTWLAPKDYKLHVFGRRVEMISVMTGRFQTLRCNVYRRPWNKLNVKLGMENIEQDLPPPQHLETMIEYAEALSNGLDYIRVDLYDTADQVFFGELTPTPSAGMKRFEPRAFDRYLGGLWRMS